MNDAKECFFAAPLLFLTSYKDEIKLSDEWLADVCKCCV